MMVERYYGSVGIGEFILVQSHPSLQGYPSPKIFLDKSIHCVAYQHNVVIATTI
jgi:hypothetical protein